MLDEDFDIDGDHVNNFFVGGGFDDGDFVDDVMWE